MIKYAVDFMKSLYLQLSGKKLFPVPKRKSQPFKLDDKFSKELVKDFHGTLNWILHFSHSRCYVCAQHNYNFIYQRSFARSWVCTRFCMWWVVLRAHRKICTSLKNTDWFGGKWPWKFSPFTERPLTFIAISAQHNASSLPWGDSGLCKERLKTEK